MAQTVNILPHAEDRKRLLAITTVSSGMLQVGDGGTSGSLGTGAVALAKNSALAINRSDTVTVSNTIAGDGDVIVAGQNGTTILSGANTGFTGQLKVTSGAALAVASDTALGKSTLALVGSSTTPATLKVLASTKISNTIKVSGDPEFNTAAGATATITGAIIDGSSSGDVVVSGAGTLALTAVNTYSGPTTISSGSTLALQGSGSISNSSVVTNSGRLDLTGMTGIRQQPFGSNATATIMAGYQVAV